MVRPVKCRKATGRERKKGGERSEDLQECYRVVRDTDYDLNIEGSSVRSQ